MQNGSIARGPMMWETPGEASCYKIFCGTAAPLLGRQRTEIERLRAARDAEGLDYRIPQLLPAPNRLRRV